MSEHESGAVISPVGDYEVISDNRMPDASVRIFRIRGPQSIVRHVHRHCWQMYLVISGTVEVEKDGTTYRLGPYATLEVPVGVVHGARPLGGEAVLANISVPPLRADDQHLSWDQGEPPDMHMPGPESDVED